jgi:hypothetical protein
MSVTQEDVVSMTLKNANGEWSFTKDEGGQWQMAGLQPGEQFNANNLTSLLSQYSSVRLTQPLGKADRPEYGMAQPLATVTLKTKKDNTEATYTLQIGAKDTGDGSYVVKASTSDYYVRVAEYTAQDAVERQRSDFLVQPTPTPAPTGGTPQAG